tara:strand:- start:38 stop:2245 length:2208 start_codon:yes stop_codon:yes gene_type:complete
MASIEEIKAAAARRQAAARQSAAREQSTVETSPSALQQYEGMGFTNFVAQYEDGQILENPQTGERVFTSPGYNTTDPEVIDNMMQGTSPAETGSARIQEQIIEQYPVASRAATALQGVPFVGSYTDEAVGLVSPQAGEAMGQAVEAVRAQRPGQATALEMGGALAATPALVAAAPAAIAPFVTGATSLGGKMLRGAVAGGVAGATEGAVSGYGRGEGEGRLEEAGTGALLGGGLGFGIGGALPGVSTAIRAGFENIKGRSVGQISKTLGISTDAAKVVRTALENDDLVAATVALERAGSSSMLADAGPATQRLLDVSVTSGGTAPRVARQAVEGRAEEAGARMTTVLDNVLGAPEGVKTAQRGIRQGTQKARDNAYRVAYAQTIDYSGGRGRFLENQLKRVPQSAINRANELMRLEGVESAQILADVAENGAVSFRRLPDVRQLDYITRAMGDVAEQQNALGKLGGTTQLGRATANLQQKIRKVLKAEVPQYGDALDVAADAISRSRAVEAGADILKLGTTREAVKDALRGASKAERNAAKSGLRSAIDDTLAKVNAVASDPNIDIREFQKLANNLRSRSMRDKMVTLLGKGEADNLYKQLDENVVSLELRAAIARNSATQGRKAIQGVVEDITSPGALSTLMAGEPINATKRVVQTITGTTPEARTLRQMGIYDEIANTLVNLRGSQAKMAMRLVERAIAGDALNETQARVIAKVLTTPAAVATYSFGKSKAEQ